MGVTHTYLVACVFGLSLPDGRYAADNRQFFAVFYSEFLCRLFVLPVQEHLSDLSLPFDNRTDSDRFLPNLVLDEQSK